MQDPQAVSISLQRSHEAVSAPSTANAEAELVERARRDPEAFTELYRRHYAAIGNYLYRRCGDRHATEDMLSETFLAALEGMGRYRGRSLPFRHWLYRIATNVANKRARKLRRQFEPLDESVLRAAHEQVDSDRDPRLSHALLALSPKLQAVITLHYVEGLPVDDVARVLGCRPGTVKSRLSRARDALAARLDRER